jgi:hypothetical protein
MRAYWTLMEQAHGRLVSAPGFHESSGRRFGQPAVFERVYSPALIGRAEALLKRAAKMPTPSSRRPPIGRKSNESAMRPALTP